jgi:hypothetical protein
MKDPVLAILTCRMMELQQPSNKEIKESLEAIYQEYFVDRGEKENDIYLKSVGLWCQ